MYQKSNGRITKIESFAFDNIRDPNGMPVTDQDREYFKYFGIVLGIMLVGVLSYLAYLGIEYIK